ncbi:MAG: PBP1A family penicillin-binding protein [Alphaproteobacteria bacterium]|nr:PBP1A family penicillin-binding protein [Alphaproteobacteria bacterium]
MSKSPPARRPRPALTAGKSAGKSAGKTAGSRRGKAAAKAPAKPAARPARSWRRRLLRWTLKWSFVASIWLTLAAGAMVAWFAWDMPDVDAVEAPVRRPAITMVAADGAALARFGDLAGDDVTVDELPLHLIHAVLAIEDRRYYDHFGLDPFGIARAMVANIRAGRMVQGGSTITQQLAKNLFLTPERSLRRKVQEALLALWLEANYSKEEILAAYLNRVYLGAGTYGVDAAARTYFGVSARNVTLHQAAILAGLLRAPSRYAPTNAPELAEARADTVLAAMLEAGYISARQLAAAEALPPLPRRRPATGRGGQYFADWVAERVPEFAGFDPVDLHVTTTLDADLQRRVEAIAGAHLDRTGRAERVSQVAVVVMRRDGGVVAMVGGRSYADSQFNRATTARRQPGSAFKPVVYLAALEAGLSPNSLVRDAPIRVGDWTPGNFNDRYEGEITLTRALARSANAAAVRVLERAGVGRAVDAARRLGLTGDVNHDLSLALGTSEVTLLELTAAYAAIANDGRAVWPYGVLLVRDRTGRSVYRRDGSGAGRATDPRHARALTAMLEAVLDPGRGGTGRRARLDGRPAAGKTGTSQAHRDAWFVGFTADFVAGVWVGNDDGTPMDGVTGGGLPAVLWHDVMLAAHEGRPFRALPAEAVYAEVPVAARPVIGAPLRLVRAAPPDRAGQPGDAPDREGLDGLIDSLLGD